VLDLLHPELVLVRRAPLIPSALSPKAAVWMMVCTTRKEQEQEQEEQEEQEEQAPPLTSSAPT